MNNELMFSSANQAWATRWEDFDKWNKRFNFTLDVCAGFGDQKCDDYITPDMNGLELEWKAKEKQGTSVAAKSVFGDASIFWCNPPYGAEQKKWVNHGFSQQASGVFLLPSRTDTILFHDTIASMLVKCGDCKDL